MNKLLIALAASAFAFGTLGSASSFAADAAKKQEELTADQKTEIRDRVERLKAERTKAEQATTAPAAPAKKADPKRTSKATPHHGSSKTKVSGEKTKKTPPKV